MVLNSPDLGSWLDLDVTVLFIRRDQIWGEHYVPHTILGRKRERNTHFGILLTNSFSFVEKIID